jgi:hypothetical protein
MGIGLALIGRIRLLFAALVTFGAAVGLAYIRGRTDANDVSHEEELNEYVETRKRIDRAGRSTDATAARKWLSERKSGRDM